MVDPPTYRAEPDPAFAARLERLLLQRLTAASDEPRSIRRRAASDGPIDTHPHSDDEDGDLIMLETETRTPHQPPPSSRRGSPGRWLMAAAAAAVVALVGTLVVTAGDDDEKKVDAADTTPTTVPARDLGELYDLEGTLEPGRYFLDPDDDPATSLVVSFEVAAEGWSPFLGVYKQVGNTQTGMTDMHIVTIDNLARHACTDHRPADPPVGPSVDDLATALAALEPFEVSVPPTDVTLLGYEGKHVQLTMPLDDIDSCEDRYLSSWRAPQGDFNAYPAEPGRTEDFWILDVDGQRLVIATNQGPASSVEDLAERDAIFDSIRIQP